MNPKILFLILAFTLNLHAANYYVSKTGDDSAAGTEAHPWKTIQKAANTLLAGDTVFIETGTYNERVTIQNSGTADHFIVFTNYQDAEVTIDGSDITWWRWNGLFDVSGKNFIEISGLRIKNSYYAGIFAENSNHINIKNNYIYNTYSSGIGVWSCSDVTAQGNEVELACNNGEQECISFSNSYNCEIFNNHIHDNGSGENGGEGIDVKQGSHDIRVYQNLVHHLHERIGIYADAWDAHTYNIDIFQNEVHHCGNGGITVQTEMGGLLENINIYNNLSYYNKWDGIGLGSVTADTGVTATPVKQVSIINNTCYKNGSYEGGWGYGILVDNPDAEDVVIRNNICSENSAQIGIQRLKSGKEVDHNLLYGNNIALGAVFGSDSILSDPLFEDAGAFNFHLQGSSPAIDNGSSVDAPDSDFDNNIRPAGSGYDRGAYEHLTTSIIKPEHKTMTFSLFQNYPNPFNPTTTIHYRLNKGGFVSVKIYDLFGRVIADLVNKNQKAGNYHVIFNAENLPSGTYYYKIKTNNFSNVKKMILLK